MSGVRTGTRLERLQALALRIRHDLYGARTRQDWNACAQLDALMARVDAEIEQLSPAPEPQVTGRPRTRREKSEDRVTRHLERLGVTAREVKTWAVGAGLTEKVHRGRIKGELVEAYEAAHITQHTIERTA